MLPESCPRPPSACAQVEAWYRDLREHWDFRFLCSLLERQAYLESVLPVLMDAARSPKLQNLDSDAPEAAHQVPAYNLACLDRRKRPKLRDPPSLQASFPPVRKTPQKLHPKLSAIYGRSPLVGAAHMSFSTSS